MKISFDKGRWSYISPDGTGWSNFGFLLNNESVEQHSVTECKDGYDIIGLCSGWREELHFTCYAETETLIVRRCIVNTGRAALALSSIADGIIDDFGAIVLSDMHEYTIRYMHSSNMRTELLPDSRPEFPFIRPVPYEPIECNIGEGNDFPAIVLCAEESMLKPVQNYQTLLVEGDLDQTQFVRSWKIGLHGEGDRARVLRTMRAQERYALQSPPTIEPGEKIQVSHVYYQILRDTHPQDAFTGYVEQLRRLHKFYGERSPMLHGSVFCTWNFGTFNNINETLLRKRSQALAERIPECTHFIIDDGYQKNASTGTLDTFYPDPATGYSSVLFPNGMKRMAEIIAQHGQTPCIWLTPKVMLDSDLAREHPDWLLRDAAGSAAIIGQSTFLDVSHPQAMSFLLKVFDTLFLDWGYRGIKFDFMTQWFTMEKARYAHGGSGVQWRDRVFGEIRKRIGDDGLFMTCIAMSMGNPFPGRNAESYRCGCDIHECTWPEQLKSCKATLPQILLEGRKTFLLNMDSAGFGTVPENEQLFRLTWVFITQGILELGGAIETLSQTQIELLRRLCSHVDRGHRVRCLDERAFTGDGFPEILKVDYPAESITVSRGVQSHIAFFNHEDRAKPIGGKRDYFGIDPSARITDFWSGARLANQEIISEFLLPRSAKLFEIAIDRNGS